MRAFISKKSRVPWVFSPRDTMRASPTMSRTNSMSSWGRERWEPLNGTALASIQAVASAGMGGGSGSGGSTTGSVVSPPHAAQARSRLASRLTAPMGLTRTGRRGEDVIRIDPW